MRTFDMVILGKIFFFIQTYSVFPHDFAKVIIFCNGPEWYGATCLPKCP